MRYCNRVDTCEYFTETLAGKPEWVAESYKSRFCHEDVTHCARYVVSERLGLAYVPATLGPHESMKAVELMQAAGQEHAARLFLRPQADPV